MSNPPQIDHVWNAPEFPLATPKYFNFAYDVLDVIAQYDRNRLAMIWVNQQGDERRLTFYELSKRSNEAANLLIKHGISPGDRVLLQLPRIPEWWIFSLALIKLGAVQCVTPTLLTPYDIQHRINFAKIKMVITDVENAPKFDAISDECPTLLQELVVDGDREGWINYKKEISAPNFINSHKVVGCAPVKTKSTDPMLMLFTSGTSKAPKLVVHNFAYALGHYITAKLWHGLHANDLHWTMSDTGWGKNIWGNYFGQWMVGTCVFIYDIRGKFCAEEILPVIEKYAITSFCAPPTVYRMLVLHDLKRFDFRELRSCTSAGEVLHAETAARWSEGTGITIREGYGQTETVCMIATFEGDVVKQGSMGHPSPGWDVILLDDDMNPVADNEEGRIAINISKGRPVGLFDKYVNNREENEKSFVGDYYFTGDKARCDADGYYWFIGRNDDVIKSSGYRIGPGEVEEAMMQHAAVCEVSVIGVPDPLRGARIKAFVILAPGFSPTESLVYQIQQHTKRLTAPYKYPREIEFLDSLPKTLSGKIKRDLLHHYQLSGEKIWTNHPEDHK